MMPATDDADDGSRRRMPTTDSDYGCSRRMPAMDYRLRCVRRRRTSGCSRRGPRHGQPEARPSQLIHVFDGLTDAGLRKRAGNGGLRLNPACHVACRGSKGCAAAAEQSQRFFVSDESTGAASALSRARIPAAMALVLASRGNQAITGIGAWRRWLGGTALATCRRHRATPPFSRSNWSRWRGSEAPSFEAAWYCPA